MIVGIVIGELLFGAILVVLKVVKGQSSYLDHVSDEDEWFFESDLI